MKYAVVSGASSGIGYALSEELGKRGYTVFGISPEHTHWGSRALEQQYGLIPVDCDISKLEEIKRATAHILASIAEAGGAGVDLLFNNAGVHIGGAAVEMADADVAKIFSVNVTGHIYMTKYLVDSIIATKGAIVYTSSIAGIVPCAWSSCYGATKSAIDMYAKVLHSEMKPFGVRVHSVIAGCVNTPVLDASQSLSSAAGSRYDVDGILNSRLITNRVSRNSKYPAPLFAKKIVASVVAKTCSFNLYRGYTSRSMLFLSRWFPLWIQERVVSWYFGQTKVWRSLAKKLQQNRKLKNN